MNECKKCLELNIEKITDSIYRCNKCGEHYFYHKTFKSYIKPEGLFINK